MPISAESGYIRPTYDELLASRIEQAQELFGEDIDTSNASPLGKFIRLAVQDLADAYEVQEVIYFSRFPHTATGQNLDRLTPFVGISRNPATRAEHSITFHGTPNHTIYAGFLVGTTAEEEFFLLNDLTLDDNGDGVGVVQCTELGTIGNVALGSITEIVNPDIDVLSIEHTDIVSLGEDTESDTSLRERFDASIEGVGSGTASSIRSAVLRVTGVRSCIIVENATDATDAAGRPPHCFEVYVHAPESVNQEIGEAIYSKKPAGIISYGSTSVDVENVSGQMVEMRFSRVTEATIYIRLTLHTDSDFEVGGPEQIKDALIRYVGGLGPGDDVIYTNLYKYIYEAPGVVDVPSLEVSTDGVTWATGNIQVAENAIATLSATNVEVSANAGS